MRKKLNTLLEELKHLKQAGVTSLYCEEESIKVLRAKVQDYRISMSSSRVEGRGDAALSTIIETSIPSEPAMTKKEQKLRAEGQEGIAFALEPPVIKLPEGSKMERWDFLRNQVLNSPVCKAHVKPGKKIVFGVGNLYADIFFCGEAPGSDEEKQGEPFVGRAGQLLTKIINAMSLKRSDVYIANIMNWRPDMSTPFGNRPPTQKEMNYCLPYLKAQLAVVEPKVIVALGATAVSGLLRPDPKRRMSDVRGRWFTFEDIPLMVTFHPSYLLRNDTLRTKRQVWEDMLKVMERIGMTITTQHRNFFLPKNA